LKPKKLFYVLFRKQQRKRHTMKDKVTNALRRCVFNARKFWHQTIGSCSSLFVINR